MRKLILFICIISLCSCSGKKGFYKYAANHPEALAKECADKFPPLKEYIKGETIVTVKDSLIKGDSIPCKEKQGKVIQYVKCPDVKIKNVYQYRVDTVMQIDSAVLFLSAKQKQTIEIQGNEIKELKSKNTSLILTCIILGLGLIGMFYFWIRK